MNQIFKSQKCDQFKTFKQCLKSKIKSLFQSNSYLSKLPLDSLSDENVFVNSNNFLDAPFIINFSLHSAHRTNYRVNDHDCDEEMNEKSRKKRSQPLIFRLETWMTSEFHWEKSISLKSPHDPFKQLLLIVTQSISYIDINDDKKVQLFVNIIQQCKD